MRTTAFKTGLAVAALAAVFTAAAPAATPGANPCKKGRPSKKCPEFIDYEVRVTYEGTTTEATDLVAPDGTRRPASRVTRRIKWDVGSSQPMRLYRKTRGELRLFFPATGKLEVTTGSVGYGYCALDPRTNIVGRDLVGEIRNGTAVNGKVAFSLFVTPAGVGVRGGAAGYGAYAYTRSGNGIVARNLPTGRFGCELVPVDPVDASVPDYTYRGPFALPTFQVDKEDIQATGGYGDKSMFGVIRGSGGYTSKDGLMTGISTWTYTWYLRRK